MAATRQVYLGRPTCWEVRHQAKMLLWLLYSDREAERSPVGTGRLLPLCLAQLGVRNRQNLWITAPSLCFPSEEEWSTTHARVSKNLNVGALLGRNTFSKMKHQ